MPDDKYIQQIYDRAMTKRSIQEQKISKRLSKDLEKQFWKYLPKRLESLIMKVIQMQQDPKISKSQIDEAERGVSKLMSLVRMHTLPEVITQLIADADKKRYVAKLT